LDATPKQHALIKLWFKDARKTYNLVMMDVLKSNEYKNIDANHSSLEVALVKQYVSEQGLCGNKRLVIMLRTPNVIRQQAVKSVMAVLKQYRTQVAKREMLRKKYPNARAFRRNIRFNPGFKSKKMTHDSISIERRSFSFVDSGCCNIFRTWTTRKARFNPQVNRHLARPNPAPNNKKQAKCYILQNLKTKTKSLSPDICPRDFKVHIAHGKLYLILPFSCKVSDDTFMRVRNQDADRVCAIDPGVRKFMTVYSPQGQAEVIGLNTSQVLNKLKRRITKRRQKMLTMKRRLVRKKIQVQNAHEGAQRMTPTHKLQSLSRREWKRRLRNRFWRSRKRYNAAETKGKNVIRNLHYNAAHHLLRNYETVILPHTSAHQ
jgi:hypothetical protein